MVLGYIPRSEGYIPLFFQGTIVRMGTVVWGQTAVKKKVNFGLMASGGE
jgi:hypothetical protein